jgi:hypothetical protein
MSPPEAGLYALFVGFLAGYLFHGWEFDGALERLARQYDDLERRIRGGDIQ